MSPISDTVRLNINGRDLTVAAGATVAAAVLLSGVTQFRTSITGQPRAALCGMGICFECRLTIDGRSNVRSCQIPAKDGMIIHTS
jgi:predicted molibdopterin-dependent oxidoreductase YjgC